MSQAMDRIVGVFGSADPAEGSAEYEIARRVGAALGAMGYTVVNGGYGGTMEASARGAVEAGGKAIGVICTVWKSAANAYVSRVITTTSLEGRLEKLIEMARGGYVVLPGSTGTLQELAVVWERMCKKAMPVRPIVCVGEFWRPLVELMASQRPRAGELVGVARAPEELGRWFGGAVDG